MDVWVYFHRVAAEIRRRCPVPPEMERYAEDTRSEGRRGIVDVLVSLREDAYLKIYERIEIPEGGGVRRYRYAYTLIVDGVHVHRWERDATHANMPVHEHAGADGVMRPSKSVTLEDVLRKAWVILSAD